MATFEYLRISLAKAPQFEMFNEPMTREEVLRAASDEANATTTELQLKNDGGNLAPSGTLVEAAVTTATSGGGEVVMKSGKKTIYSSSMNRKTAEIDPIDMPEPSSIETIRGLFRKLLNR